MKIRILLLTVPFLFLLSCNKDKKDKAPPPQNIKVVEVIKKKVPIYKEFVGQIYGNKDIPIRARVEGFLEKVHFNEGTKVKKGTLLYSIDSDPFLQDVAAARSKVAEAETILIQSESDLNRIKPLVKMDAVSKRELDMAQAKRDASESSLSASNANLKISQIQLSYTKIYAPITGVIGNSLAEEGEFVGKSPNPIILNTISDISRIKVKFYLSERDFLFFGKSHLKNNRKIKDEDKVEVQLILVDDTFYDHIGKIDFIDRSIDPSTGAIMLQASFPNPDGLLRPGQFSRLKIMIKEDDNALLVPQKVLSELQGQFSVFVVGEDNKVVSKIVETGAKYKDYTIVKGGLKFGDKVVLEGLQKVKSGMVINPEVVEYQSEAKQNNNQ